jgi:hypothetical protein
MQCMFHVFMLLRIVSKLCYWQQGAPIVLSSSNKLSKVVFNPSVHSFGLSIGTRVEGGTDILLYSCHFTHCLGKVTDKLEIST